MQQSSPCFTTNYSCRRYNPATAQQDNGERDNKEGDYFDPSKPRSSKSNILKILKSADYQDA